MNAPDCICSPGRLPLGAFCAGRDDLEREALHDDRISIRAPRAGRDFLRLQDIARALISIHAPRVGRDYRRRLSAALRIYFNPRAPCGARHLTLWRPSYITLFQSTRPVWGATVTCCANHPIITLFQSTRPVWGATLKRRLLDGRTFISIHAPRVGRDPEAAAAHKDEQISIHAPRVGRDHGNEYGVREYPISIHAPGGGATGSAGST